MRTEEIELDTMTADGEMAVVVTQPVERSATGDDWPTVVIFIDAPGLRQATRDFMARLASYGYRVITPDLHHRHGRLLSYEPADRANNPEVGTIISGWIASMTDDQIQNDARDALAAAGVSPDAPYAVIGFCLGARGAVRAMERNPDRVLCGAGWHPSFLVDDSADSPHLTAAQLTQPMFFGVGADDQIQSYERNEKFFDAVADKPGVDIELFPGTDHGYTWPGYPTYNEHAAETSWTKTLAMLSAVTGPGAAA